MDQMISAALVGSARQEQFKYLTGTPVDELLAQLPTGEAERTFLLSAGVQAVYRLAGQKPGQVDSVPEPSGEEELRSCPPAAIHLLSLLLGGTNEELLPEALERLHHLGMRVPSAVLPQALNVKNKEARAALFPVLGERGRWLSQFNPAWRWVRDFLPANEQGLPTDAETIWQEGTNAQRVEILRRLRAVDPATARAWLLTAWKRERAEVRADLLATFATGLSVDDEEFLENSLNDRALGVRVVAADLLANLPGSAYTARMLARGKAMLNMNKGKLVVTPPAAIGKDWVRDGISENPPNKLGKRAWWLIQVLALIPPSFWEEHLGTSPTGLLALVAGNEWEMNLIDGWSKASIQYQVLNWIEPLWDWWLASRKHRTTANTTDSTIPGQLLTCLPQKQVEQVVLALLRKAPPSRENDWALALSHLPRPWSTAFGEECLRLFRACYTPQRLEGTQFNPYTDPWFSCLSTLALALPPACFVDALQPWDLPESTKWHVRYAGEQFQHFTEIIQMRKKIYEEIV